MALPNAAGIFLDNFWVLRYEGQPARRFRVPDSGFANRLRVPRSKLHRFNYAMRPFTVSGNLFILVASITSLSTAFAGSAPAGRFPEPLEKSETQPAPLIYRLETSPRMISQYGSFISYQVNVDAN